MVWKYSLKNNFLQGYKAKHGLLAQWLSQELTGGGATIFGSFLSICKPFLSEDNNSNATHLNKITFNEGG